MATGRWTFGRAGTFWTSFFVLVVCLWAAASPSILYPLYAEVWHLTEVVTTGAFAVYPAALLLVLVFAGGISDRIGRKRTMILGVSAVLVSAVVCAWAPGVGALYAGRALQGIGTGFALSAASASLVEHNPSGNQRWASIMTTIATSLGLAIGVLVGGAFAEYLPAPLTTSYLVLLVATLPVLGALLFTPRDTDASTSSKGGATFPRVPRSLILVWVAAALACALAYGTGAIVVALGADLATEFTGTDNSFVIGALMAGAFLCVIVASLFLSGMPPRVSVIVGVILSAISLVLAVLSAATSSLALFAAWMIVTEVVFAFAFTGGIGLMNRAAPPRHRAAALSLVFLVAYVFQAVSSLGVGAIATASDLHTAMNIAAIVFAVVCVATLIACVADARATRLREQGSREHVDVPHNA